MDNEDKYLSIYIECTIVQRMLDLLDSLNRSLHVEKLSLGYVYYGSIVSKKLILHNNSPVTSDFVIDIDMSESVNVSTSLAVALNNIKEENGKKIGIPFQAFPQKVSFHCEQSKHSLGIAIEIPQYIYYYVYMYVCIYSTYYVVLTFDPA